MGLFSKAKTAWITALAGFSVFLFACAQIKPTLAMVEPKEDEPETSYSFGKEAIVNQAKTAFKEGIAASASGHLAFTVSGKEATNTVELNDASLNLRVDELSLAGLRLTLHAPISYGNNHFDFDLALTKNQSNESYLYFSVDSQENADLNHIRYKVGLDRYFPYGTTSEEAIDEHTGGIFSYSYGQLDWLIHDIAEILTGEGSPISAPSEEEPTTVSSSDILDSLNDVTQTSHNALPYFVWNLPLGEKNIPIGFASDASYKLTRIDFPSKTSDGDYKISDALSAAISLEIQASSTPLSFAPRYQDGAYRELQNSALLFEKVATLVTEPQFGLTFDGSLRNYVAAQTNPDDPTILDQEEIDELLNLHVNANVDYSSYVLNAFDGDIELGYVENSVVTKTQEASFYFDAGEEGAGAEAYFQVNHILMAKATKTVLDAFIADLVEAFGKIDIIELLFGSLKDAIEDLLSSAAVEGIKEGTYDEVVPLLESIETEDNLISLTLNGQAMSLSGQIKVTLDGNEGNSLVSVEFINFALDSFYINGLLTIADYVTPTIENPEDYHEMTHLQSVEEQVVSILQNESASFELSGHFYKLGANEKDVKGQPQGFDFSGTAHIDVENKRGAGELTFTDRKDEYRNDHHLKINVQGPEGENEQDNYTASYTSGVNNMLVTYDSQNDSHPSGENRTDPKSAPLAARFSIHSLNDIIDLVKGLMDSEDDRFKRLFSSFTEEQATDLISSISNKQYFSLFKYDLIEEANLGEDKSTLKIPGSLLGQTKPVQIEMEYYPESSLNKGIKKLTVLAYLDAEDDDGNVVERELYISISSIATPVDPDGLEILSDDYASRSSSYIDFSSLSPLMDYLYGTATLGETDTNKASTYQLEGTIAASLGSLDLKKIEVRFYAYVNGATTKLHAQLSKIPVISGFTDSGSLGIGVIGNVLLNQRQTDIYYYADGANKDGTILMMRKDVYSKVFWKDTYLTYACMSGREIRSDLAGWLVSYALGINMDAFTSDKDKVKKSPHAEDIIKSFSFASGPKWSATIDLGEALDTDALGTTSLTISGLTCTKGSNTWKTLSSLTASVPVQLLGLDLLNLNVNVSLKNVSTTNYSDGWTSNASSYNSNFNDGKSSYARNPLYNGSSVAANHYKDNKI